MVHPTAAAPLMYNRYTAPFIFLVTDIPPDFRKWLVTVGVYEVSSQLGLLFVENGVPIAHDYAVTLTNYNLRIDTDVLRERAHEQVKKSVVELLFDKPSEFPTLISKFIQRYRDNIDEALSKDEALQLIRSSVQVNSLEVISPDTKTPTITYNVYIHPPTAKPEPFKSWRGYLVSGPLRLS